MAAHAARVLGGGVLVTNDAGEWHVLSGEDYGRYVAGTIRDEEPLGAALAAKDFFRDHLDFPRMGAALASRHLLKWPGPSVHTLVVTRRCNLKCVYCHASVVGADDASTD
ncbi:MAG: hypothetical protein HY079_09735, partial [Elusimicrobia bacterium]|nr:hypothetical protein [Elusimicrobiota bacterium]